MSQGRIPPLPSAGLRYYTTPSQLALDQYLSLNYSQIRLYLAVFVAWWRAVEDSRKRRVSTWRTLGGELAGSSPSYAEARREWIGAGLCCCGERDRLSWYKVDCAVSVESRRSGWAHRKWVAGLVHFRAEVYSNLSQILAQFGQSFAINKLCT